MPRHKATKVYEWRFTVRPSGAVRFPIDMLRYDACYPAFEEASRDIEAMMTGPASGMRSVALVRRGVNGQEPNVARWASFGWAVDDMVPVSR